MKRVLRHFHTFPFTLDIPHPHLRGGSSGTTQIKTLNIPSPLANFISFIAGEAELAAAEGREHQPDRMKPMLKVVRHALEEHNRRPLYAKKRKQES